MALERMREEHPEEFARVAHRAVENRALQKLAFQFVVFAELFVFLVLAAAVVAFLMALVGTGASETARDIALLGATMFTAIWSGFLVVGNYFCYWYCHEGGQNTHDQMTLWGMANIILIAAT